MVFKRLFGMLGGSAAPPSQDFSGVDMSLSDLKAGDYVDYDMKTWEVVSRHHYDWGDGDITHEWQLKSHDDTIYLEKETDDEADWSISRPVVFGRLGEYVKNHILQHEDPPSEILFDGETYYLESSAGGHFYPQGKETGQPLICWDFEDESGDRYLSIEQWGESEFEAYAGHPASEYQFTNFLPGEGAS